MNDTPKVPVAIKVTGCKKSPIDYPAEMFAFLDVPRKLRSMELPPPTLGVLALWELASCRFFQDPFGCEFHELARAVWICWQREKAVPAIEAFVYADDAAEFDGGAELVKVAAGDTLVTHLAEIITFIHTVPWEGFRMIPPGDEEDEPSPFIFDGAKLGKLCAMGAEANLTPFETLWRTPMTRLGHLAAAISRRAGVKGIERPYDEEDVIARMRAAQYTKENLLNG